MTGHNPWAQQWREWLNNVVGSLGRLDGASGLEFCESFVIELGDELRKHGPETQTVAELLVAEVVAVFQKAAAGAYLDKDRPRAEVEQLLRNGLEHVLQTSGGWVDRSLSAEEVAGRQAQLEIEIEASNAQVAESLPKSGRPDPDTGFR